MQPGQSMLIALLVLVEGKVMPPLTLRRLLAMLVLILAVVLAAIGKLPFIEACFFAALAGADLVS